MDFKYYLIEQIKKHPCIQPQDVIKLCYQAAFGAEHLLYDISAAKRYFDDEFESVEPRNGVIFECLSDDVARVDLGVWKRTGMPREWLFNMFVASASIKKEASSNFEQYLLCAEEAFGGNVCFSLDDWRDFLAKYKAQGTHAVHHSDVYREKERPAYRIVDRSFLSIFALLEELNTVRQKSDLKVVAIDGRAASGKSTLAEQLRIVLNADVVHMDDFFLPPLLRSQERLDEAGGNIHYERFISEVVAKIKRKEVFSYRVFDCGKMDYCGNRTVGSSEWRIVEGSYSHHPRFGKYADFTVFCTLPEDEQIRRIIARNGEKMAEMFKKRWIPMEEKYFSRFSIGERSDMVICSGK